MTSKINKEFNVTREAEAAQKIARDAQEQRRQASLASIKDQDERKKIEDQMRQRDTERDRAIKAEEEKQARFERNEVQRRLDVQRQPQLTPEQVKGKAPDQVAREVRKQNEKNREEQVTKAGTRTEQFHNKAIDRNIQQTLEQQSEQDNQRAPDQVFEKSAQEKSASDAFNRAKDSNDAKSWRRLRSERQNDDREL